MTTPPAVILEATWLTALAFCLAQILAQQEVIERLRDELTALASELAILRVLTHHT